MNVLADEIFHFTNPHNRAISQCWVRVYGHPERATVIWTEIAENQGMSVTNAAQYLASQLQEEFTLDPLETIWIEHYGAFSYEDGHRKEEYNLVQLSWNAEDRRYEKPQWSPLDKEKVEYLIAN